MAWTPRFADDRTGDVLGSDLGKGVAPRTGPGAKKAGVLALTQRKAPGPRTSRIESLDVTVIMQKRRSIAAGRRSDRLATPEVGSPPAGERSAIRRPTHDVVGALYAEHQYVARLLGVLEDQISAASRDKPIDRRASLAAMSYMTQYPDAYHHPREDAMFARLAKRDSSLVKRIAEVKRAHRTIGSAGKQLLADLQRLEDGTRIDEGNVVSRMNDYANALREHMTIEERDLFPRAREVLDDRDLEEIDRAFARVIDPIFEAAVKDAYAAYSPLIRYLVDQPAVRQALDVLDTFYRSAETLGETLFGRGADKAVRKGGPERVSR
jgi:hemerythrin-like domain-containing protein